MRKLGLFSGRKKYKVDYNGIRHLYHHAKECYRAGTTVTVYFYLVATDTDYRFYINDKYCPHDYDEQKGLVLSFVMPEEDVTIRLEHRNLMVCEE